MELGPESDVPSLRDQIDVWSKLAISPLSVPESPAIRLLLSQCERRFDNGGARLLCFVVGPSDTFDWYVSRAMPERIEYPNRLLLDPIIRDALDTPLDTDTVLSATFEPVNSFTLDGTLAATLASGGAYWRGDADDGFVKQVALGFCEALFGERWTDVVVHQCFDAWSPWFRDVAWDVTWTVYDRRHRRFWLLMVTDTD